jgi:RimJ/RimL family protein N-acetyltransferase
MTITIRTARLTLVVRNPQEVLAEIDRMDADLRAQVSPEWLARARAATTPDPWTLGFAMIHQATELTIGSCAFKAPPDADAMVEIAYHVSPEQEGNGYASEAAAALAAFAFSSGQVEVVRAHTLPVENASCRVLTKCGFHRLGEVIDPEDGLVWRWELQRPATR